MTGGAGVPSSSPTVRGRCSTQTTSFESTVTDDTWPVTQSLGMFGHDASTSNRGTPPPWASEATAGPCPEPDSPMATTSATTDHPAMILQRMSSSFRPASPGTATARSPAVEESAVGNEMT